MYTLYIRADIYGYKSDVVRLVACLWFYSPWVPTYFCKLYPCFQLAVTHSLLSPILLLKWRQEFSSRLRNRPCTVHERSGNCTLCRFPPCFLPYPPPSPPPLPPICSSILSSLYALGVRQNVCIQKCSKDYLLIVHLSCQILQYLTCFRRSFHISSVPGIIFQYLKRLLKIHSNRPVIPHIPHL
jgi:hypothetical protein